jgi:DNA-binding Xre family transcriptional regulator
VNINSQVILSTLKVALKKQKITYKDLGNKLNLTEAAIKKQFQAPDISFSRVLQICDVLGVSVNGLIDAAKLKPIEELSLSKAQESYFLKHPREFLFFLKLSEERGNVEKTNNDFQFNESQLWSTLKKLDDHGLIKLHKSNKVELIFGSLVNVSAKNPLMSQLKYELGHNFLKKYQDCDEKTVKVMKVSLLRLTKQNAERLKSDLIRINEEYLRQSEIDGTFSPTEISKYSLITGAGQFSFL